VNQTFYNDRKQVGGAARFGALPWEFFISAFIIPTDMPARRIEYLTANPDIQYSALGVVSLENFGGFMTTGARIFPERQTTAEEWFRQPLAPGFAADTGVGFILCNACRNGDLLSLFVTPVTDSTPDHSGFLDFPGTGVTSTTRFRLFSGSTVLVDQNDVTGVDLALPAGSAPYKLVYDQTRRAPWFVNSTVAHTEWTFTSAHSASNTVPDRVFCDGDAPQACSAVSLVTLNYQLSTSLTGTMRAGPASLLVTVGHTPGAPEVPISTATVALSFDVGKTWTPVIMENQGGGKFRAIWTNPASVAGGPVMIRVTAKDTAGNTVTQTVRHAYVITGGSGA
jgi:hypothetical protein